MSLVEFNTERHVIKVDKERIAGLKSKARERPERKYRLCLHKGLDDPLHEMLIVQHRRNYIRPHRHPLKSETFHVIEGSLEVVLFDDNGVITENFSASAEELFLFRVDKDIWHTIIPVSDVVVVHEITNGPFSGNVDSLFPEWAPPDGEEAAEYVKGLLSKLLIMTPGLDAMEADVENLRLCRTLSDI